MVVTATLETPESRSASSAAGDTGGHLLLVPKVDGRYATVGTVAKIENAGELPNGQLAVVVRGLHRARIGAGVAGTGTATWVEVEPIEDAPATERAMQLAREYRAVVENILEARGAAQVAELLRGMTDPGQIADTAVYSPDLSFEQKVEVLEAVDVTQRLEKVLAWAWDTLGEVTLKDQIRKDVSEGMEKSQREFILRQQLAAIRKELGEGEDGESAIDAYRAAGRGQDARCPSRRGAGDRPAGDQRAEPRARLDPDLARHHHRAALGRDLHRRPRHRRGLPGPGRRPHRPGGREGPHPRVPGRAQAPPRAGPGRPGRPRRRRHHRAGRPAGVGKTSLASRWRGPWAASSSGSPSAASATRPRSVATGAPTWAPSRAASPGRSRRPTMNPVFLLDEVDKVGADWRGDPPRPCSRSSTRPRTTPSATTTSRSSWTCRTCCSSPPPTWSRRSRGRCWTAWRSLRLDGYTEDEKLAIARDHLLARQLDQTGLRADEVVVTEAALRTVVGDYTRGRGPQPGARDRQAAAQGGDQVDARRAVATPLVVDDGDVRGYLGRQKFFFEAAERTAVPGVATGLAVTGTGGDVLFIEASVMDGEPGLTLTGQLGDVMKESASIALSYVRAHAGELGIDGDVAGRRYHVHVPAGAVPKDGPSAGVTMTTALASLLTGRPVRAEVGMTGEVTLQGRVLPIGGVKQKVLAAHRAGLKEIILPERNGADLEDVPESVRSEMTFHLASEIDQVLVHALAPEGLEAAEVPTQAA